MRDWLSTGAARAWLGVALAGLVVIALVVALMLIPRLGSGQEVLDAAEPAFTDARVDGTRAGVFTLSQYVDVVDPLLTRRGGGAGEVSQLIGYLQRKLGLSEEQVRRILRREAPHTESLLRALPLDGIAAEVPRLTAYLATIMGLPEEELAAILERDFPRISQALTALSNTSDGWYDVPGIDGLTRLRGDKPVRTLPGLRKYVRDDVVPLMVAQRQNVQDAAAKGGIGYIPVMLLLFGAGLLAFGLFGVRRTRKVVPGKLSWGLVVAAGALLLVIVGAGQYVPRLGGAQEAVDALAPVFREDRVRGTANGLDTIHDAIALGDPIMTPAGGAAAEVPRLYRLVAQRTGRSAGDVRSALRRRAPQTTALLGAIPLTDVGNEIPDLLAYLRKALRLSRTGVVRALRKRTPALVQALLTTPDVARGWNAIPGTGELTRFDGVTAVRTMTELDGYLRDDLVPVLVTAREDFETFADGPPSLDELAPLLLITGLVVMLYGAAMMKLFARRY
jgi:hypothetical protein